MIFQQFNLVPRLDVLTNVLLGRLNHRSTLVNLLGVFSREERAEAIAALERLDIARTALQRGRHLVRRPAAARCDCPRLMQQPKVILADEPIASLDPLNAKVVMDSLQDINLREGITVVTNLHTLDTARTYCNRIIGMAAGKVVFDGPPEELNRGGRARWSTAPTAMAAKSPRRSPRPASPSSKRSPHPPDRSSRHFPATSCQDPGKWIPVSSIRKQTTTERPDRQSASRPRTRQIERFRRDAGTNRRDAKC